MVFDKRMTFTLYSVLSKFVRDGDGEFLYIRSVTVQTYYCEQFELVFKKEYNKKGMIRQTMKAEKENMEDCKFIAKGIYEY
jgi:hypothetical protein